jgi:hypothetical protein
MRPLLNSTNRKRLVQAMGLALIVLAFYAMLTAIVLLASFVLLQKGITPELPWVSSIQKYVYMKGARSLWQNKSDCVDFDAEVIYKPKLGACQLGRFTGNKPAGKGIAVIGDSHTMGWGVQDEETYAAELQRLSNRPVFNLGVASYGTVRELMRLEKSGMLDRVDTVILQYCADDLKENRVNRINSAAENREKFNKITTGKMSTSRLLRMFLKAYGYAFSFPFKRTRATADKTTPAKAAAAKAPAAQAPDDFLSHYQQLMAVLEKHPGLKDKRVLIFYNNGHGQRFQSFPNGKDKRLPNVEFVNIDIDSSGYYRLDDHMTPAGHKTTAQHLFKSLGSRE